MEFYLHFLVCPHGGQCNFIFVSISVYILLHFCLHFFCFMLYFFVSLLSCSSSYPYTLIPLYPYTLYLTVHIPTHVVMLVINMLVTSDRSRLGHNIVYLGRQTPKFRRSLLFAFRVETYRSTTFLSVTQCNLLDRHQYFRGMYCFRLPHRRRKQNILPKH